MRTLLIGALIATLMGCCRTPPQATLERCTAKGCVQRTAANPQTEIKRVAFKPSPEPANVKSIPTPVPAPVSTPEPAPPAGQNDQTGLIGKRATPTINSPPDNSVPSQSAETLDAVVNKAKATTAATLVTLADPESAEFDDMKRANRKDMQGQPVDSICGRVKVKKASGESISDRPFLYLVKEDKAFIDDGYPESVAATWYRAVCINPDSPRQDSRQQPSK
jgi:type IV secretory pathway VirB10-like protein